MRLFCCICFVLMSSGVCSDEEQKSEFSEISFFVLSECVSDVKRFVDSFRGLDTYYAEFTKIDHSAGVVTGFEGIAIIGSKEKSKKELESFVYGSTADCAPKKTTTIDLNSKDGLLVLNHFLGSRKKEGSLDMYIVVKNGVMHFSLW